VNKTKPNLPKNNARCLIASCRLGIEARRTLKEMDIQISDSLILGSTDRRLAHHTDLGICHVSTGVIAVCPQIFDKINIRGINIVKGMKDPGKAYPLDAAYNVCVLGKYAIHNFEHTDKMLIEYLKKEYELIHIRQAYSKCLISPVTENFVITQDKGIAKALEKKNIDVLLIEEKEILLDGYPWGFIGGASFMANKDTWVLNGALNKLDSCYNIEEALRKYKISYRCLANTKPVDTGSFVILYEDNS
jgi:hypothetical protein